MNIQEWQAQIWECPNMNPTAVAISLAIGSHGNWSNSQTVWPSRQRISTMTGASRETVGKYMTALEEQGWIKVVKIRKDNVREYELSVPQVVETSGILAINKKGNKDNLKNQVVGNDEQVVETLDKQVVGYNDEVVYTPGRNLPRPYQENLQEELTIEESLEEEVQQPSAAPPAAVELDNDFLEGLPTLPKTVEPSILPNASISTSANAPVLATFNQRDMMEGFLSNNRWFNGTPDASNALKELVFDRTFQPDENRPNFRWSLAITEIKERGLL